MATQTKPGVIHHKLGSWDYRLQQAVAPLILHKTVPDGSPRGRRHDGPCPPTDCCMADYARLALELVGRSGIGGHVGNQVYVAKAVVYLLGVTADYPASPKTLGDATALADARAMEAAQAFVKRTGRRHHRIKALAA